jgi:hypothetical protein
VVALLHRPSDPIGVLVRFGATVDEFWPMPIDVGRFSSLLADLCDVEDVNGLIGFGARPACRLRAWSPAREVVVLLAEQYT